MTARRLLTRGPNPLEPPEAQPQTVPVGNLLSVGLDKHEFVRTVAFTFIVYKLIEFGVVAFYTPPCVWTRR